MRRFLREATSIYESKDYFIYKKAQYTLIFLGLMMVYGLLLIYMSGFDQMPWYVIKGIAGAIICSSVVFYRLLKRGYLVLCQYLFLVVGISISILYLPYNTHFQFYVQLIMVLIVIVTVHVSKKQMVIAVALVNSLVIFRAYFLYSLTNVGFVDNDMLHQTLQAALGIGLFSSFIVFFDDIIKKEIGESEQLSEISIMDTLTHLPNRASFNKKMETMGNTQDCYVVGLIDIDSFKGINDQYGHPKGDDVLMSLANLMRDYILSPYEVFRWGGEEFAIIVESKTIEEVKERLNDFRQKVARYDFGLEQPVTISVGLAYSMISKDFEQIVIAADNALYQAKKSGRNCVVVWEERD